MAALVSSRFHRATVSLAWPAAALRTICGGVGGEEPRDFRLSRFGLTGCQEIDQRKADARPEGEVKTALRKLTGAYGKRNMKALLECFASDADVVLDGAGADEKRIGLGRTGTQAQCDWGRSDASAVSYTWSSVSAAGATSSGPAGRTRHFPHE